MGYEQQTVGCGVSYQERRELRYSGVLGSVLRGGDITKAAALAQFLDQ